MKKNKINSKQNTPIVFKRWNRRAYSAFSTLKHEIQIATLTGIFSIILMPSNIYSQPDTITINKHLAIDEVIVSSSRTPKTYNDLSRVVSIISSDEIQNSAAQSIQELLEFAMNVDVRQRGAMGIQADVSIRGGSFEQTLFLLNGIPVNNPQTGHHNLNIPIDIESIERIEILMGPATRVYGPNAFTGAINIITNSTKENYIKAILSGGMYGLYNGSASTNYTKGKLNNYFSAQVSGSDGYTNNTDFKSKSVYYNGNLNLKSSQLALQVGYLNKAFGANGFYTQKYPEQFEQIKNIFTSLGYKKSFDKISFSANAHWQRNHDRFELFREDIYHYNNTYFVSNEGDTAKVYSGEKWYPYSKHNYHMTDVAGFNVSTILNHKLGKTTLGFDLRYEHIYSNNIGENINDTINAPGEKRGTFFKEASRNHLNIFIDHDYTYKRYNVSLGVMMHYNTSYGTFFNGGIEMNYSIINNTKCFASVNQSLRIPSFTDLYYQGASNFGNPDLTPEKAISYEIGLKAYKPVINWHTSVFIRDINGAIEWVKYPSDERYTSSNLTQLSTYGFELSGKIITKNINALSNFITYIQLSYSYTYTDKHKQDSIISIYALDYLVHKLNLSADFSIYKTLGLRVNATLQDRNGTYTDKNNMEVDYKPFIIIDARLYYKWTKIELFADASNLLNSEFVDLGGIEQAGFWFKTGLKIKLGL